VEEIEACVPFDPARWDDATDPDGLCGPGNGGSRAV
jgi:hypothetical protein